MKAILTVIGQDKVGIVAGVSCELAQLNISILDISQTIMEGFFTMTMMCNIANMTRDFSVIKEALNKKGQELGVQINIQREEIFLAMHKL